MLLAALAQTAEVSAEPHTPQPVTSPPALEAVAAAPTWRALTGFDPANPKARESDIITEDFFLAPDGDENPLAELVATKAAMEAPLDGDPNRHAQCLYPARRLWLTSQNVLAPGTAQIKCPAYETWLETAKPASVSIIFASGHLTNPATFYGHMMLRIGSEEDDGGTLLDTTMNYGAVMPENENGLLYVTRGLSGQYESTYTVLPFYQHLNRFNEVQMRDVWQYELNLTADQTQLLAAHAWEHLRARNRYYYLRQNCAYRIVELLGVVVDENLVPEKPWVMPVDVLESLAAAHNGDQPLVREVRRLDSRQTRLRDKYVALPQDEQGAVMRFLRSPEAGVRPAISALPPEGQKRVVETLIDYYGVAEAEAPLTVEDETARRDVLKTRFALPSGQGQYAAAPPPAKPHQGQKSTLLQFMATSNSTLGEGLEFRFRPAYNDFLSLTPGSLPYSELAFGDLRLGLYDNKLSVRSLDAIRITTLNVSQTGLPHNKGFSWRVRFGAEQAYLGCEDCLAAQVEAAWGQSAVLNDKLVGFALAGGRLRTEVEGHSQFDAGLTAGLILNAGGKWRSSAEINMYQDVADGRPLDTRLKLETRYGTSDFWDLAGSVAHQSYDGRSATEVRVGFSRFW